MCNEIFSPFFSVVFLFHGFKTKTKSWGGWYLCFTSNIEEKKSAPVFFGILKEIKKPK